MASQLVSAARQAIFATKHIPPCIVTSRHLPDVTVAIRALTLEERREMLNASKDEEGELDGMEMILNAVIWCATEAVSGERLFSPGDRDQLSQLPAPVIDDWAGPALDLNGLGDASVKAAEKNSATTPSSSTSSSSSAAASADEA